MSLAAIAPAVLQRAAGTCRLGLVASSTTQAGSWPYLVDHTRASFRPHGHCTTNAVIRQKLTHYGYYNGSPSTTYSQCFLGNDLVISASVIITVLWASVGRKKNS